MKTIIDLCELLRSGKQPIVTFGAAIEDKEGYPEALMRARAIRVSGPDADKVMKVTFAFEEFSAHNAPLESANYFDASSNPTQTARQAGYYKPEEQIYFDFDEPLDGLLTIEPDASAALFETYRSEKSALTYLQWLEAKVLALPAA